MPQLSGAFFGYRLNCLLYRFVALLRGKDDWRLGGEESLFDELIDQAEGFNHEYDQGDTEGQAERLHH